MRQPKKELPKSKMREQLKKGKKREYELDEYFSPDWVIHQLSRSHERKGLGDRIYINRDDPLTIYLVEYKADEEAAKTGNIFVETVSVDTAHKLGWVITCQADFIFIYIPANKTVFVVSPDDMRERLSAWQSKYPIRPSAAELNNGYRSYGILVPIAEIESASVKTISVNKDEVTKKVNDIISSGWV